MISRDAVPIAHHPPRKPIDLRPTYPHAQTESRTFWEIQYEESIRIERGLRNERMWRAVVEFAQGRGTIPVGRPFVGPTEAADKPDGNLATSGSQDADSTPVAVLEDDRNSTGIVVCPFPDEAISGGYDWRWDSYVRSVMERGPP